MTSNIAVFSLKHQFCSGLLGSMFCFVVYYLSSYYKHLANKYREFLEITTKAQTKPMLVIDLPEFAH